ncbi:ribonuclease [Pseudomonas sp. StFLB209]|nr:ribonuclease [Pseudomonas sp. StFLB209]
MDHIHQRAAGRLAAGTDIGHCNIELQGFSHGSWTAQAKAEHEGQGYAENNRHLRLRIQSPAHRLAARRLLITAQCLPLNT